MRNVFLRKLVLTDQTGIEPLRFARPVRSNARQTPARNACAMRAKMLSVLVQEEVAVEVFML